MANDPNDEVALGLNKNGIVIFIVLLLMCFPLCWLPWIIGSCKASG